MDDPGKFEHLMQFRVPANMSAAIERAAKQRCQSKADYFRQSIIRQLEADGIELHPGSPAAGALYDRLIDGRQRYALIVGDDIAGRARRHEHGLWHRAANHRPELPSEGRLMTDCKGQRVLPVDKSKPTEQASIIDKYRANAAMFERSHPDFRAAYEFFMCARAAELKAIGYDTPQALHQALIAEELVIVQMAFRDRRSPAEVIYGLAHARGFTTPEMPRPMSFETPIAALKGRPLAGTARPYTLN